MERFDRHVSPAQIALEQAPEIVQALCVNLPPDVFDSMINDFVDERLSQVIVADSGVRVDLASVFDQAFP